VLLICAVSTGCGGAARGLPQVGAGAAANPNDPLERMRLYEARVAKDPRLPVPHAELGAAYLDQARATGDASWLARARKELETSVELQPSADAYAALAALCNFSHRFACALDSAERAARLDPRDGRARELRIEAYLGLGEAKRAEQLLVQPAREDGAGFVLAAARGRCLAEQGRYDDALKAFETAADQARGDDERTLWAEIHAASALIDSGRPGLARAHLESATQLLPASFELETQLEQHWAEVHDLEQRPAEALRAYESLLAREKDPELYRRAADVARRLGDAQRASALFAAAEAGAERILAAGEIYALETQARLYADAGVKLERAEELAVRNLQHKRDRAAYETLAYVRKQRATPVR
jgi:tetratricopeptide (TPR) repeat protein